MAKSVIDILNIDSNISSNESGGHGEGSLYFIFNYFPNGLRQMKIIVATHRVFSNSHFDLSCHWS